MKRLLGQERGGITILMVLSFMMLGTPVISSALNLADAFSRDSKVKTRILKRHYCGLAAAEYVRYLTLEPSRWNAWWANNQDPNLPAGTAAEETITLCAQSVTLRATHPPPSDDILSEQPVPSGLIPNLSAYNNRKLRSLKSVDIPVAAPAELLTYTIAVQNLDSDLINQVTKMHDRLPQGFCYQANSTSAQITSGSTTNQISVGDPTVDYLGGPTQCPDPSMTQELEWNMPNIPLASGDLLTLTFQVTASPADGTYCNEAWADPGSLNTRSGMSVVQVGSSSGVCPGTALKLSKTVVSASGLTLAAPSEPLIQKFTFNVGYAITIENIGANPVEVERIRDLLPPGFSYNLGTTTGDISFNPNEHLENNADRWRLTWDFNPKLVIPSKLTDPSGSTKTVSFYTTATVQYGDYWNDVLLTIDDDDYDDPIYSWPTAVVTVREAFDVEVTGPGGNPKFISIQVIVGTDTGVIARWDIR